MEVTRKISPCGVVLLLIASWTFSVVKCENYFLRRTYEKHGVCLEDEVCHTKQLCNPDTKRCDCLDEHKEFYGEDYCPTLGQICRSDCCCGAAVQCVHNVCIEIEMGERIVSQVILSTVMVIGFVSVIVAIYRMCTRVTMYGRQSVLLASENSPRASLSSLQIGVLARLQDRPPLYETRHNYERTVSEQTSLEVNNLALQNTEMPRVLPVQNLLDFPPPPYLINPEADSRDALDLPPAYTIAIATPKPFESSSGPQNNSQNSNKELYI